MKSERVGWILGAVSFAILHGCFGFLILGMALENGNSSARTTSERILMFAIGMAIFASLLMIVGAWMRWKERTMYALVGAICAGWVIFYIVL